MISPLEFGPRTAEVNLECKIRVCLAKNSKKIQQGLRNNHRKMAIFRVLLEKSFRRRMGHFSKNEYELRIHFSKNDFSKNDSSKNDFSKNEFILLFIFRKIIFRKMRSYFSFVQIDFLILVGGLCVVCSFCAGSYMPKPHSLDALYVFLVNSDIVDQWAAESAKIPITTRS